MADAKKDDPGMALNDISAFMQKMWNPFGVPMPGFGMPGVPPGVPGAASIAGMPFPNPAAMFATLDPAEIGRKIDELKVVQTWLQMSLNMMQLSIKTMELQKASIEALTAPERSSAAPHNP
ncbi:MAG: PhaM family polyhydroxyalkanoate granule multifunctional regulatory protein [Betaproteobacteria bacterium]